VFYAFDLLHLDGKDLTGKPLVERRALLPEVLNETGLLVSQELPVRQQQSSRLCVGLGSKA
jgi:ATP-dependent DNA ligase